MEQNSPPPQPDREKEQKEKLKLNILVAEDQEDMRGLFKAMLGLMGHKVTLVENGQLLVNELLKEGNSFDLVVSDNTMPEKIGIEALAEIRSMGKFEKLPFVLATTDTGTVEHDATALGATFLRKPFGKEALSQAIERAMK